MSNGYDNDVKIIADAFAKASGGNMLPEEGQGFFSRAVRNLSNAFRAVRGVPSVQGRFGGSVDDIVMGLISSWACQSKMGPPYGTMARDEWLHEFVFSEDAEPILNGAIHTFTAKIQTLNWFLQGPEDLLPECAELLENMDVDGWTMGLGRWVNQYGVLDIGGLMEIGWRGAGGGRYNIPGGLYGLDGTRCRPTRNVKRPFVYYDQFDKNARHDLKAESVLQILSMPNPGEEYRGLGLSPVSRALRSARLLDALHNYEHERLLNLPPEGVATVTGMTMAEVRRAMQLYEEKRKSKDEKIFPGILWFVASKMPFGSMQREIGVKMVPFSTLPSYFDKKTTVELFVKTLALSFGVDVAEFWQIETHGATKAQATLQAQKAKGKGIGLLASQIERQINWKVLPSGVVFKFDILDDEDDMAAAMIRMQKIDNLNKLYYGKKPAGGEMMEPQQPLINFEEARWLLVNWGIIPSEFTVDVGYRPLEPEVQQKLYIHKLGGFDSPPNPFPKTPEGMEYALKRLSDELASQIRKELSAR